MYALTTQWAASQQQSRANLLRSSTFYNTAALQIYFSINMISPSFTHDATTLPKIQGELFFLSPFCGPYNFSFRTTHIFSSRVWQRCMVGDKRGKPRRYSDFGLMMMKFVLPPPCQLYFLCDWDLFYTSLPSSWHKDDLRGFYQPCQRLPSEL